jgi:hypothetical protein
VSGAQKGIDLPGTFCGHQHLHVRHMQRDPVVCPRPAGFPDTHDPVVGRIKPEQQMPHADRAIARYHSDLVREARAGQLRTQPAKPGGQCPPQYPRQGRPACHTLGAATAHAWRSQQQHPTDPARPVVPGEHRQDDHPPEAVPDQIHRVVGNPGQPGRQQVRNVVQPATHRWIRKGQHTVTESLQAPTVQREDESMHAQPMNQHDGAACPLGHVQRMKLRMTSLNMSVPPR